MEPMDCSPSPSRRSSSISFPTLPQLCHARFIQLCPAKILQIFSCTNKHYRILSSNRPMVKSVVSYSTRTYHFVEFGKYPPQQIPRIRNLKEFKKRYEVIESVEIKHSLSSLHAIQLAVHHNMALNASIKREQILWIDKFLFFTELFIETNIIDFNALMVLVVKQPLKKFTFKGGINFICTYADYKDVFDKTSQIDWVRFTIMLSACSYTNATADQIIFFLMDNVRGFTEHCYGEKEISYNNLTRNEAILQACNSKTTV